MLENILVKVFGWRATILHGDPCVVDRWRWLARNLRPGSLRTLDAGCGSGAFTLYAAKVGNEAVGISFDEQQNRKGSQRAALLGLPNARFITANLANLDELAPELGEFDQIICFETIEHIMDDRKLASNLARLLKPGGRLLLTTPNKYYRPLYSEDPTKLSTVEDGGHVRWGYTHDELQAIFAAHGLAVIARDYASGYVSQKLTSAMRVLLGAVPMRLAWALVFPLRALRAVDAPLTGLLAYPYLSVCIVAEKPATASSTAAEAAVIEESRC